MVVYQIGRLLRGSLVAVFELGAEEVTAKDDLYILPNAAKPVDMQAENRTDSDLEQLGTPHPKPLLDVVAPISFSFSTIWYRC